MVEYTLQLDNVFHSLSDPIRRDILRRVTKCELTVSEIVRHYDVSFAAISKHLKVLENAKLIHKRKEGRKQIVTLAPSALRDADMYLEQYRQLWQSRHEAIDGLLREM